MTNQPFDRDTYPMTIIQLETVDETPIGNTAARLKRAQCPNCRQTVYAGTTANKVRLIQCRERGPFLSRQRYHVFEEVHD
jgi:hypothetical protein